MTRRGGPGKAPRQIAAAAKRWDRDDRTAGIEEARDRVHALQRTVEHALVFGEPLDELGDHIVVMLSTIDKWLDLAAVAA